MGVGEARLIEETQRPLVVLVKRVVKASAIDRVTTAAAGLAFHSFLAIFPAIIAAVGVARLVGLTPSELSSIAHAVSVLLPGPAAQVLLKALKSSGSRQANVIAVVVGVAVAAWSSVETIAILQMSLDVIFHLRDRPSFIRRRLVALPLLGFTLLFGGIAAALLVLGPQSQALVNGALPRALAPIAEFVGVAIRVVGALVAVIVLLTLHYGFARRERSVRWRAISVGSGVATIGWVVISIGFSLYLSHSASESKTYGSFAPVAVLLLWFFLIFVVILIGAELDQALESAPSGVPIAQAMGEESRE
ncbi:MAG: YihY/virulence factor BrkB family protein [Ferrimicrobium sp.]